MTLKVTRGHRKWHYFIGDDIHVSLHSRKSPDVSTSLSKSSE